MAGAVFFTIGCVALQSQLIQISNEVVAEIGQDGAVVRAIMQPLVVLTRLIR
jgi:hypothetical protein